MADLKPDRVRAAELAQTGAGRGRARGEQAEREHESTCTLLEHGPDFAAEAAEAAATPTGDSQQRDAEAACARDWSRHWQAGAFAAWGWGG